MRNAFNVVSRQAFLSECSLHFPELYPWVLWCYGQHPILWHPMGTLTSECGVQQGDPLGPLLFCLVLNILVKDICSDPNCAHLSFHSWYLDDGVVAGPSLAVQKVLALIEEKGPPLGLLVNFSKCEVFSPTDVNLFRGELIRSSSPNIVILGVPIGDLEFCSNYISNKCASAKLLLHKLEEVGAQDAQVALVLLRLCGSFCKLAHLARATPPSLSIKALELFDIDVRHCFSQCTAVDTSDEAWLQAQLSLSRGGLGLRSLSSHAAAAYIASLCSSDFSSLSSLHLTSAIGKFNSSVSPSNVVSVESLAQRPPIQKALSAKIDDFQFNQLFNSSSLADRARLLSISSPHASSWLSVVPSEGLGLHLNPDQFQVAIKWWLGLDTSGGSLCSLCPDTVLDPLGHHASTCKRGGDAVFRHNRLRVVVAESCRLAHLSVKVEAGNNLTPDHSHTRPADVLVQNWSRGRPAAFDICVTSPLNTLTLSEAGVCAGAAAQAGEVRKHSANDDKCGDLGWFCVPLVTETYGAWGAEAKACFSQLASRLSIRLQKPKSVILYDIWSLKHMSRSLCCYGHIK